MGNKVTAQEAAPGRAECELVLRPHVSAPQQARDFVEETFSAWRLDGREEPAVLVTSELVTNAVRHAGTDVTVRILRVSSGVRIEVADRVGDREPHIGSGGSQSVGGVGLMIVERLAEDWGVEKRRNGKAVWAWLAVDGAPDAG